MLTILSSPAVLGAAIAVLALAVLVIPSLVNIGPTEVGLVIKRFSGKKVKGDNPIAFDDEAGYQADLLPRGWRFKFWILYQVEKFPYVQIPAGEIGVVISQIGEPLPQGAKSGIYKPEFGNFLDLKKFLDGGGQKGVQRPVLGPGASAAMHPVAFLVVTKNRVYGLPVSPELKKLARQQGGLNYKTFGLEDKDLKVTRIGPEADANGKARDMVGVVTALEGDPLPSSDIACRLTGIARQDGDGPDKRTGFSDLEAMMQDTTKKDLDIIETLLGNKNALHNNYQDFQAFIDHGGRIGVQHDTLMPGAYNLNPFLVKVEMTPMLVVNQGEVAVIKAFVGLMTEDVSGVDYKHGSLVRPGRRGIWQEPLRTGKYAINPHCYQWEIVPTAILTLNWAEANSKAHDLDEALKQIDAKSKEGFEFAIDLQVQIHVPDTKASRVISSVGTMFNLVNEVLQAAVGNHFRDTLQSMPAINFIETRQKIQEDAFKHIQTKLSEYDVETKGVYIQDVVLPEHLVKVLTEREIANQEIETYKKQKDAEQARIDMMAAKGTADMQAQLAQSKVGIDIQKNNASAIKAKADGEAEYTRKTGEAEGAKAKAIGEGQAAGYQKQVEALGPTGTAIVNAINGLAEHGIKLMPDTLVVGGGGNSGSLEGVLASVLSRLGNGALAVPGARPVATAKDDDNGAHTPHAPATAKPSSAGGELNT